MPDEPRTAGSAQAIGQLFTIWSIISIRNPGTRNQFEFQYAVIFKYPDSMPL